MHVALLRLDLLAGAVQGEALQGPGWRHPGRFRAPAEIRPQNLCLPHFGRQDWQVITAENVQVCWPLSWHSGMHK